MIIVNTNVFLAFYKRTPNVVEEVQHIGLDQLAVSAATQAKLCYGKYAQANAEDIKEYLETLTVLPISLKVAQTFNTLREAYMPRYNITLQDLIVVATALVYDAPFYTLNSAPFRCIEGLTFYYRPVVV